MSINKDILEKLLFKEIEKHKHDWDNKYPYLSYTYSVNLLKDIIYHNPTQDYTRV